MAQTAKASYTSEEYLALDRDATDRNEYYRGQLYLMAGGSVNHSSISSNVNAEFNLGLRRTPCRTLTSDMKAHMRRNGFYAYPNAVVVCGEIETVPGHDDIVTNPILLVEVLSPSTASYDRSGKFELYRALLTFAHYLLVDQDRVYVEYFRHTPEGWLLQTFDDLAQTIHLALPGGVVDLALADVYDKVAFTSA